MAVIFQVGTLVQGITEVISLTIPKTAKDLRQVQDRITERVV